MFSLFKSAAAKKRSDLRAKLADAAHVRLVIGAGTVDEPGWLPTDVDLLNVTRRGDWEELLGTTRVDALMAEHVWEHLTVDDARAANGLCFEFLKPGGSLRIAVPDGLMPNAEYREHVRPGGTGPGALDHKILYDYKVMSRLLEEAGFAVELLEYWDESGNFHAVDWTDERGHIRRSKRFDPRNQQGTLNYTSLIVDGVKRA